MSSDVVLKVIVLGESGTGKTSVTFQFIENKFNQSYPTVTPDYRTKQVTIRDKKVSLQIWDTLGYERFECIRESFYRRAHCCILVFSATDKKTFERLEYWKNDCLEKLLPRESHFPFIVFGNKIDLVNKGGIEFKDSVLEWCKNNDIPFVETSAKEGTNVSEGFYTIAAKALEYYVQHSASVQLNEEVQNKSWCYW